MLVSFVHSGGIQPHVSLGILQVSFQSSVGHDVCGMQGGRRNGIMTWRMSCGGNPDFIGTKRDELECTYKELV